MPASSGSALGLAARLRGLDDAALARLVAARGVRAHGIDDFFDLAEALLDRGSVQAALQRLDRPVLALLATAGELAATEGLRRPSASPRSSARRSTRWSSGRASPRTSRCSGSNPADTRPGMPWSSSCARGRRSACRRVST
ncbi:hypothetical protein [Pseudolysinimonas kribbensis]|uniref:hypothetical protein n=1 Tax=Pseudolysinimonas kribbensis TaxID=433641 RepID=UPI0024E0CBC0|nr:hypothetical protein [Pseudolysinimonas kribbensis]